MAILTLHSQTARSTVGNGAAAFALQRLGIEVWAVPSIILSNHTGHDRWAGWAPETEQITEILEALITPPAVTDLQGILTGYIPGRALIQNAARAIDKARTHHPKLPVLCDPVFGHSERGLFLPEKAAEAVSTQLIPRADIATPNRYELSWLTGLPVTNSDETRAALVALANRMGEPETAWAICTSVPSAPGRTGAMAVRNGHAWQVETVSLPVAGNGAGDLFSAVLLHGYMNGNSIADALSGAVSKVFSILQTSTGRRDNELGLVAAQDQIIAPLNMFPASYVSPDSMGR